MRLELGAINFTSPAVAELITDNSVGSLYLEVSVVILSVNSKYSEYHRT